MTNFLVKLLLFQSTLPRGSDYTHCQSEGSRFTNFNPRSLAGATKVMLLSG